MIKVKKIVVKKDYSVVIIDDYNVIRFTSEEFEQFRKIYINAINEDILRQSRIEEIEKTGVLTETEI